MYHPLADERPSLQTSLSQEITAIEVELYSLAPHIAALERMLARKAELERRVSFLRDMETSGER